jgi:hypothetical protein
MSVRVSYLYRDADNYKAAESAVIAGDLTAAEIAEVWELVARAARGAGVDPTAFSPVDLRLPPAQERLWATTPRSAADHIYNELLSVEPSGDDPTGLLSAANFLARLRICARTGYNVVAAMERLDIEG